MHLYEILKRPIMTEKGNYQAEQLRKYAFEVDRSATKQMVRQAVEHAFDVTVESVHIINMKGKRRRWGRHVGQMSDWKKAIVTLAPGDTISFFEGV
ncbi:MAG: 50S ribosomal protein L23 [Chloroflexi bacterium]|nr:50S ribosomal protein L23 [Chloroflexota bacterium]